MEGRKNFLPWPSRIWTARHPKRRKFRNVLRSGPGSSTMLCSVGTTRYIVAGGRAGGRLNIMRGNIKSGRSRHQSRAGGSAHMMRPPPSKQTESQFDPASNTEWTETATVGHWHCNVLVSGNVKMSVSCKPGGGTYVCSLSGDDGLPTHDHSLFHHPHQCLRSRCPASPFPARSHGGNDLRIVMAEGGGQGHDRETRIRARTRIKQHPGVYSRNTSSRTRVGDRRMEE